MATTSDGSQTQLGPSAVSATSSRWRDIDWDRCRRSIDVGGQRLGYAELGGAGAPLLLIHGLGGNWTVWLENMPTLAQHHRVLAVDLPGFGSSATPQDGISINGYADTVQRFCEALKLESVTIFGSSLGGWVAAELAQRESADLAGLVLVDAAGIVPTRVERWKVLSIMEGAARMAPLAPRFRKSIASRQRLRALSLRYTVDSPADLAADLVFMALPEHADPGFRPALTAARHSWSEAWCDRLSQISCPTLIVWGAHDSLLPLRHGREFERRIPGSQLAVIAGAGHLPMIERPAKFNRLALEFVSSVSSRNRAGR